MSTDNVVRHVLDDGTIHYHNTTGELHRTDGPALVRSNGTKKWYQNGKRHREDGPAVVMADGTEEWYRNGERHREDGPAVVYSDGSKLWYLNGVRHRKDGPAVVCFDDTKEWYLDGERHREDGPAVVYPDCGKEWYLNGVLHRADGPAVIDAAGNYEYWIDGVFLVGVIPVSGQVYFNRLHQPRLSTELVVKVMSDKGFGSVEEFGSWLAFVVLGEEAIEVMSKSQDDDLFVYETERLRMTPVIEEYLRNHEDYASLPFSWWYPIVEGRLPLS